MPTPSTLQVPVRLPSAGIYGTVEATIYVDPTFDLTAYVRAGQDELPGLSCRQYRYGVSQTWKYSNLNGWWLEGGAVALLRTGNEPTEAFARKMNEAIHDALGRSLSDQRIAALRAKAAKEQAEMMHETRIRLETELVNVIESEERFSESAVQYEREAS